MTDTLHNRLHLQLKELNQLRQSISSALQNKIQTHLDDIEYNNNKDLTKVVESIINEFIDDLFNSIKYSIDLDGISIENLNKSNIIDILNNPLKLNEKVEPHDFALDDKLRDLYAKVEIKIEQVTKLRKSKPNEVYNIYETMYIENLNDIDKLIDKYINNQSNGDDEGEADKEDADEANYDDLKLDLENMLQDLVELKDSVPETKRQLENMSNVLKFVEK
ncbi:hypothetical protein CANARDRAFT_214683 [[Candida] arabinofermentans NRRL YB-2248]|uniref:Uncharacterized protein n=1 Tax=[Candida] arabinofermentans NRRL YB-2248 TaxID=983967 RepID=A0A1E4SUR6_9ASCO|nr:hypothetical protein CANARDRAFT_214683 [[Candida] arabinofermentans NRRL YB-2248]